MDELLKKLCECDAVASHEEEVRNLLYYKLKNDCDDVFTDNLGSIVFHKKGTGPKLMLCAHMDEVGFLVKHISDQGMLYVTTLGGVKPLSQYMQKVHVVTENGNKLIGVLMCDEINENGAHGTYVDLGYENAFQVKRDGIQIGDMVCFVTEAEMLNENIIAAKALDDRCGCFILAKTLMELKQEELHCDLYIAFTSSEEVGLRGAKTTGEMVNPDVVMAVDIGSAKNVHSNNVMNHRQIGKGPLLLHYDKGCIPIQKMTSYINRIAEKISVPLQQDMFIGGGTDVDSIHVMKEGKPSVVLGIPLHYAHGAYSLAHMEDINNAIKICTAFIREFNQKDYQNLIRFLPI